MTDITVPPIPACLHHLPTVGGLVVPWITPRTADGRYLLGAIDHDRMKQALLRRLCGVCGQQLGDRFVLLMRLSHLPRRCTNEPALHPHCAAYTISACPMVSGRRNRYRSSLPRLDSAMLPAPDAAIRQAASAEPWFAVWLADYRVIIDHGDLAASYADTRTLRIRPITMASPGNLVMPAHPLVPERGPVNAPRQSPVLMRNQHRDLGLGRPSPAAQAALWLPGLLVAAGAIATTAHGLYEVAIAAHVPPAIAWIYPVITDGLALVAYGAAARTQGSARRYSWAVIVVAPGLSGLAQAAYLAGDATVAAPPALRFGVGAWSAIAAAVVAHLLHLLANAPQPAQQPDAEASPATGTRPDRPVPSSRTPDVRSDPTSSGTQPASEASPSRDSPRRRPPVHSTGTGVRLSRNGCGPPCDRAFNGCPG